MDGWCTWFCAGDVVHFGRFHGRGSAVVRLDAGHAASEVAAFVVLDGGFPLVARWFTSGCLDSGLGGHDAIWVDKEDGGKGGGLMKVG